MVELQGLVSGPNLGPSGRSHSCPKRPVGRSKKGRALKMLGARQALAGARHAQRPGRARGARRLPARPAGGGVGALRARPPRRAASGLRLAVGPAPQLHPLPPPPARSRLLKSQPARGGGAEPARRTRQAARP